MSALAINFWSVIAVGAACLLLCLFGNQENRDEVGLGALVLGVTAGVALTLSSFMLMDGWTGRMEHFDFSAFEPTMNVGNKSDGRGMMFAVYFWPYEAAALGVFATFGFGRLLYYGSKSWWHSD